MGDESITSTKEVINKELEDRNSQYKGATDTKEITGGGKNKEKEVKKPKVPKEKTVDTVSTLINKFGITKIRAGKFELYHQVIQNLSPFFVKFKNANDTRKVGHVRRIVTGMLRNINPKGWYSGLKSFKSNDPDVEIQRDHIFPFFIVSEWYLNLGEQLSLEFFIESYAGTWGLTAEITSAEHTNLYKLLKQIKDNDTLQLLHGGTPDPITIIGEVAGYYKKEGIELNCVKEESEIIDDNLRDKLEELFKNPILDIVLTYRDMIKDSKIVYYPKPELPEEPE